MRRFLIALWLLLPSLALAQNTQPVTNFPAPWNQIGNTANITASSVSSNVQLGWALVSPLPPGSPSTALVCNTGLVDAFVTLGNSGVTATTGGFDMRPGACNSLALNGNQYLAAITSSSTTTLTISTGNGTAFRGGGGGASGSSNLIVGTTAITSGTTNGLLYDNAGVLGNLATANNGVLVTSAGGVPSISTTIPSGLTTGNMNITGVLAQGIATTSSTIPSAVLGSSANLYQLWQGNSPSSAPATISWAASNSFGPLQIFMRSAGTVASPTAASGGSTAAHEYWGYAGAGGGGDYNSWAPFAYVEAGQLNSTPLVAADIVGQYQIGVANGNATNITNMQYPGVAVYNNYTALTNGLDLRLYNIGFPTTNPVPTANSEYAQHLWSGNVFLFGPQKTGSGTLRGIEITGASLLLDPHTHGAAGITVGTSLTNYAFSIGYSSSTSMSLASNKVLGWGNDPNLDVASQDSGFSRISAGLIGVGTGAQGSFAGSLKLTNLTATGVITPAGYTVSTLPVSPATGSIAYVTDAVACTFLATLTGGSSTYCPVTYNGAAWVGG